MSASDEPTATAEERLVVSNPTDATDAAAATAGLTRHRDVMQMRRPLPLSETEQASVAATRRFMPATPDEHAWIDANNRAFESHPDQGGFTPERLHQIMSEPWFDPDGFRLHHRRGALAAFCWTKLHPAALDGSEPALGEIYVIGVDPAFQGQGLGRALTLAGLAWLAEHAQTTAMLYVDVTNTAALTLYRSLGFEPHHIDRVYEKA